MGLESSSQGTLTVWLPGFPNTRSERSNDAKTQGLSYRKGSGDDTYTLHKPPVRNSIIMHFKSLPGNVRLQLQINVARWALTAGHKQGLSGITKASGLDDTAYQCRKAREIFTVTHVCVDEWFPKSTRQY